MKIGFKPQKLVDKLVSEDFFDNGNALRRIIEIPAKKNDTSKVLDITYRKGDFLPTQWYVASYNLVKRNPNSTIEKTLVSQKAHPDEIHTVVTQYNKNGYGKETTIDIDYSKLTKTSKDIKASNVK